MTDPVPTNPLDQDVADIEAASLAAMLATVPAGVRVVRVGNPLQAPLTLQRLLIQTGHFDLGADLAEALSAVTARRGAEPAVLMVIEQAETLEPAVLPALRAAIEAQRFTGPALHVVLVRSPAAPARPPDPEAQPEFKPEPGPGIAFADPPAPVTASAKAAAAPDVPAQTQMVAVPPPPARPLRSPSAATGSLQAVAAQRDRQTGRQRVRQANRQQRWPRRALFVLLVLLALAVALAILLRRGSASMPFPLR